MVQCFSCSAQLQGNWAFNTSGYVNGTYLGVNAYFAISGPNWVYCFCANCYNNGTFGNSLKQWYAPCINRIIQQATAELKQQNDTLKNTLIAKNTKITELQGETKKYKLDQFMLQIKGIVDKTKEWYSHLQSNLIEAKQLVLALRNQYQQQVKKQLQLISKKSIGTMFSKLQKIRDCFQNDIKSIAAIKQKINQSMHSINTIHSIQIRLFEPKQIEASNLIFETQIKQKQHKLSVIESLLKDNNQIRLIKQQ